MHKEIFNQIDGQFGLIENDIGKLITLMMITAIGKYIFLGIKDEIRVICKTSIGNCKSQNHNNNNNDDKFITSLTTRAHRDADTLINYGFKWKHGFKRRFGVVDDEPPFKRQKSNIK